MAGPMFGPPEIRPNLAARGSELNDVPTFLPRIWLRSRLRRFGRLRDLEHRLRARLWAQKHGTVQLRALSTECSCECPADRTSGLLWATPITNILDNTHLRTQPIRSWWFRLRLHGGVPCRRSMVVSHNLGPWRFAAMKSHDDTWRWLLRARRPKNEARHHMGGSKPRRAHNRMCRSGQTRSGIPSVVSMRRNMLCGVLFATNPPQAAESQTLDTGRPGFDRPPAQPKQCARRHQVKRALHCPILAADVLRTR